MKRLVILGRFPGINEYVNAERRNKYIAAKMKKDAETVICAAIRQQLRGVHFTNPIIMHYKWVEQNRRRDKDNIVFAKKFVQDALVKCKVLKDDGWDEIENFTNEFAVDKKNPRIEVVFEEVKK